MNDFQYLKNKYGDITFVFSSYFKYEFYFYCREQNVLVKFGGDPDEIYKLEVSNTMFLTEMPEDLSLLREKGK